MPMSIYTALLLFSFIILIYWIITELFTILFRFTGLPDERARFQVISLLTGCGYTTRESELFISNRSRRRLARITMLFGYVFNITIVSAFINVFLSLKLSQVEHYYAGALIPLAAITITARHISINEPASPLMEQQALRFKRLAHSWPQIRITTYRAYPFLGQCVTARRIITSQHKEWVTGISLRHPYLFAIRIHSRSLFAFPTPLLPERSTVPCWVYTAHNVKQRRYSKARPRRILP